MAWASLSTTLGNKPHVLAGPLLRRVTTEEATVWLALRKPCTVDLKIYDDNAPILHGRRHTVAVGRNLHIVAVTADKALPPFTGLMAEGKIYQYDMVFEYDDHLTETLASATGGASLAYPPYTRPTFCLPPSNLNALRVLHGSCRIPHGNGPDALSLIDGLIVQAADNPSARPHQLMLTGDQIYADDVGYAMLMMLSDAGEALLGWSEEVSVKFLQPPEHTFKVADLSIAGREIGLMSSAFLSVDLVCHLVGFGEYLAMYLFVWSDALWPAAGLPGYDDLLARYNRTEAIGDPGYGRRFANLDRGSVENQTRRTQAFGATLTQVRRALANIPSYMIFDDHEITDDWNMTRLTCAGMYGSPFGRRVVQNGLSAYALCQHWGNVPGDFDGGSVDRPGTRLLMLLDGVDAATYASAGPALQRLLGIHDHDTLMARHPYAVYHDPGAFNYHYTVEGPSHQILVTDTRTWRAFPSGDANAGGELMPEEQIRRQIVGAQPPTGDRVLMVVLTTNAPPVESIRTATAHPRITRKGALTVEHDGSPDIYEAWELPSKPIDRLFRGISERLPLTSLPFMGNVRTGAAILLSGDVHTSFASRLVFQGTARPGDPQASPQPVSAVYAQLVASSFRKQTDSTLNQHRDGYEYMPPVIKQLMLPPHAPEHYAGWNLPSGTKAVVGRLIAHAGVTAGFSSFSMKGPGAVQVFTGPGLSFVPDKPVDFVYRLDYLLAVLQGPVPTPGPPIPPVPAGATAEDRRKAAEAFHRATGSYRKFNQANVTRRQMVGVNNLGEITFDWGAVGARFVLHTLRWRDPDNGDAETFTTYVVSLDPADPTYPPYSPPPPTP